jgi:hypothetical protein
MGKKIAVLVVETGLKQNGLGDPWTGKQSRTFENEVSKIIFAI